MKTTTKLLLTFAAASAAASANATTPLAIDAGWSTTDNTPPAFFWEGLDQDNTGGAYTFTTPFPVILKVTDAGLAGDQFNIFDNSAPLGSTPDTGAPDPFSTFVEDPDLAYGDSTFSHGSFLLSAGSHSITIQATGDSLEIGKGYLRVDSVPDGGLSAALLGFSVVGLFWRRRGHQPG